MLGLDKTMLVKGPQRLKRYKSSKSKQNCYFTVKKTITIFYGPYIMNLYTIMA